MVWWFFVPKVAFGENALVELEAIRGSKAFIVTDSVVNSLGFPERISEILRRRKWEVAIWDCAESDPRVSIVKSAAEAIDRFAPDWIIAVGGGSVIDTAKAAWILHEHPNTDLEAVNPIEPLNLRYKAKLACVPTTAGTGSEATKDIVIRDDESGRKFGTINNEIVPDLAILEPEFVKGLPKNLTAYTGLDALTHAVEAYTSVWKNDYSDACSLKAVQMIFNWLPKSVENPEDLEAREKMLIAANLAGMSFSNAQVSLAHSIGHALGSVLRYQHGMAVGIALPYTIDYNYRDNPDCAKKYWELAMMIGILEKDQSKASKIFAEKIRELKSKIGVPNSLKEAGTSKEDLEKGLDNLVKYTIMDTSLSMNPRRIDGDTIEKIYNYMYEGKLIDF